MIERQFNTFGPNELFMNDFLNSPWFGALCIILGLAYLLYQRKGEAKTSKESFFSSSMWLQGLLGGLVLIFIGIVIIYRNLF